MNAVLGMLLLVSQFSVITVAVYTPSPDYTNPGPCAVQEMSIPPLQLPTESNCTYHCTLYGHVHAPQANSAGAGCPAGPYPVVVFFSGFQVQAGMLLWSIVTTKLDRCIHATCSSMHGESPTEFPRSTERQAAAVYAVSIGCLLVRH